MPERKSGPLRCVDRCFPNNDMHVYRWSLRFRDPGVEAGFAKSLVSEMTETVWHLGVGGVLMHVIWFATQCPNNGCIPKDKSARLHAGLTLGAQVGMASLCVAIVVASSCASRWRSMRYRAFEVFLVCVFILALILSALTETRLVTYMIGTGPGKGNACPLTGLATYISMLMMITHSFLPLRCVCVWPYQMCSILWYFVINMAVTGQSGGGANNLTLFVINLIGIWGKRNQELQRRRLYHLMISERSLRVQSDFELSKLRARTANRSKAPSETQSVASSNASLGYLFDDRPRKNIARTLRRLVTKGREEHWLVDKSALEISPSRVLGRGSFGTTMHASLNGVPVALKLSDESLGDGAASGSASILSELRLLRKIRHPHIASFHGAVVDPTASEVGLVLELVKGVGLESYISSPEQHNVTDCDRYEIGHGLACALLHLHSQTPPVLHGDLKASNIMVELIRSGVRSKLVDFGLAHLTSAQRRRMSSWAWMAPEVDQAAGDVLLEAAHDVFSFGRVLHFVVTGKAPYAGKSAEEIKAAMAAGQLEQPERPNAGNNILGLSWDLAAECIKVDPGDRPNMEQVVQQLSRFPQQPGVRASLGDAFASAHSSVEGATPWSTGVKVYREGQQQAGATAESTTAMAIVEEEKHSSTAWRSSSETNSREQDEGEEKQQRPNPEMHRAL